MANALYDFGRESFLGGDVDWDGSNIKIALIDEDDEIPDLANDQFWSDRLAGARVAISGNLTAKTIVDGTADAADETWGTVTGDESESIDCYYDSGVEATSIMICNIDTASGLPVTPNGGDITVQWDGGADRIFTL